jgi:hypothetical protein
MQLSIVLHVKRPGAIREVGVIWVECRWIQAVFWSDRPTFDPVLKVRPGFLKVLRPEVCEDVQVERVLVGAYGLLAQVLAHARQVSQLVGPPPRRHPVIDLLPMHVSAHSSTTRVAMNVWVEIVVVFALEPILKLPFQALFRFGFVPLRGVLQVD